MPQRTPSGLSVLIRIKAALIALLPRGARTRIWIRTVGSGSYGLAEALIARGLDYPVATAFAARFGTARLLKLLLATGARQGASAHLRVDGSPLLYVAHRSPIESVQKREVLLGAGAELEAVIGPGSWTLLNFASFFGDEDFAAFLLKRGADPNRFDVNGLSPIQMARIGGHPAIARMLLEYGAEDRKPGLSDIEPSFISGNTLFSQVHESVKGGIRLANATLDRMEIRGETAFRYFFGAHFIEVVFLAQGSLRVGLFLAATGRLERDLLSRAKGRLSLLELRASVQAATDEALRRSRAGSQEESQGPAQEAAPGVESPEILRACQVLGLAPSASDSEALRVYRALAKLHHPDLSPGAQSERKMKEINLAYETIRGKRRKR